LAEIGERPVIERHSVGRENFMHSLGDKARAARRCQTPVSFP
jgi:hypothetical protein